jgi:hypothetical protein
MILLDWKFVVIEFEFTGCNHRALAVVELAGGHDVVEGDMAVIVELGLCGKGEQACAQQESVDLHKSSMARYFGWAQPFACHRGE